MSEDKVKRDQWGRCLYCQKGKGEEHSEGCYQVGQPTYEPYENVGKVVYVVWIGVSIDGRRDAYLITLDKKVAKEKLGELGEKVRNRSFKITVGSCSTFEPITQEDLA